MNLTDNIFKAINLASSLHVSQIRKDNITPYISHCFAVAWIVANYVNDEDIIVAALLHDTIEDVEGFTYDNILIAFGKRVADLVYNVSEPKYDQNSNEKLSWEARKIAYLDKIKNGSVDALYISVADKIHNIKSILNDYSIFGDKIWSLYNSTKAQQLHHYTQVLQIAKNRLQSPIINELESILAQFSKII